MRRPIYSLSREVAAHYFGLEGKLWQTLGVLFARPGALTEAYLKGESERYIRPVRLYLTASVLLFFLVSVLPGGWSGVITGFTDARGIAERPPERTPDEVSAELDGVRAEIAALDSARAALQARADALERAVVAGAMAEAPRGAASGGAGGPGFWGSFNEAMTAQGDRVGQMSEAEAKAYFGAAFARHMPKAMFVLLPLFALLLKLLYVRRRRYYGEHLVFALHVHAFTFFCFIALALLVAFTPPFDAVGGGGTALLVGLTVGLVFAPAVHTTLAMRRVYGQGWGKTLLKAGVLLWVYFTVLQLTVAGVIVLALLLF